MHRDIKLDNILLDGESGVKICDFGVSKIISKGQSINEQCGTPAYIAPEIIKEEGYEAFHVDMWSLGVLLYAMLCGTVPFKAPSMPELHKLILAGEFTFPIELTEDAQNMIYGLLKLNPNDRFTIPQIFGHPWLKETNEDSDEDDEEEEEEEDEGGEKTKDGEKKEGGGAKGKKKEGEDGEDIDLKSIGANINFVNVDNLFYEENYRTKLSYTDYCCITEDFTTHHIGKSKILIF
jgi:serine/threonine protein kinase